MAKRPAPPAETPPSLTKEQGRDALLVMKEKGEKFLSQRPISKEAFDTWSQSTFDYIQKTFGSHSGHLNIFSGQARIHFVGPHGGPDEHYLEQERAEKLTKRVAVLANLVDQLGTEIALEAPNTPSPVSSEEIIWDLLHSKVITNAKARFDAGHYADAVEAAFKELNTVVKELVRKKTGQELDGSSLMLKALSPNGPIIVLVCCNR